MDRDMKALGSRSRGMGTGLTKRISVFMLVSLLEISKKERVF